jgi:hypothetical protein
MNKKQKIFSALLFCTVLLIAILIIFFRTPSIDKEVRRFAKNMNKHCPTLIDKETRLDKVYALPDSSIHFNYTLIYRELDSSAVNKLKNFMEPAILNKIKTSPTLNKLLNKNLTWIYSYNDKNGDFLFKIIYPPEKLK